MMQCTTVLCHTLLHAGSWIVRMGSLY